MGEWKKVKLGDCIKEVVEKTTENNQYEVLTSSKDGIVSQEEYFDKQVASKNNVGYKIIKKGQFTYRSMSDSGRFTINKLDNKDIGIVSPAYPVFEAKEINSDYLKYFFDSEMFKKAIHNLSQGSTRTALKYKDLTEIAMFIPSIEEQEKIVHILENVDLIIKNYEKLLKEKNRFIKSQFVEMFGNPLNNEKRWTTDKIKNIAPVKSYKGDFQEKVWLLNLDMIESNSGKIIDYLYVNINDVGSSTCTFNEENVLYSKLRPYLNKVVEPKKKGYATTELIPLKPNKEKLNRCFFAHLLRSEHFVRYISEKVAGTKMPRVSTDFLRNFEVILPPIELQNKFAKIVQLIDKQKFELERIIENYKKLKKGLMQQLLTGKIKVKI